MSQTREGGIATAREGGRITSQQKHPDPQFLDAWNRCLLE